MKCYLTGPITGIPLGNIPLFERAAHELRAADFDIVSPIEMDNPKAQAQYMADPDGKLPGTDIGGETLGEVLGRDIRLVIDDIGALVLLPDWTRSRGARLEVFCGLLYKKRFFEYRPAGETREIDRSTVAYLLTCTMGEFRT